MAQPHSSEYLRGLLEYGSPTERQREVLQAVIDHGRQYDAAEALGLVQSGVAEHIALVRAKAAKAGFSPEHGAVAPYPDGFQLGKVTIERDHRQGGEVTRTWERMTQDQERQRQALMAAIESAKGEIPKPPPERAPKSTRDKLLACYVLTDAHLGMLAWGEETNGPDWDAAIAERTILRWMRYAIDSAPNAHTAILAQLGDLLHYDSLEAVTPTHGNRVDADTRYQAMVDVVIRVLRTAIKMMLRKHRYVHIIMAEGNHDMASSVWLRKLLAALYEREPRVSVDTSPYPYYGYQFGRVSLFFTHGHLVKLREASRTFAGNFRHMLGQTDYSYGHVGHRHSSEKSSDAIMPVEQHTTLAPNDAHASRLGHTAEQKAPVITYHADYGEFGRAVIPAQMAYEESS